jgi:hypothetical protein
MPSSARWLRPGVVTFWHDATSVGALIFAALFIASLIV